MSRADGFPRLRSAAALLPAGALAVHQLRYLLAFGGHTDHVLAARGHAYFDVLIPAIALICAAALGCFVARLARAWRSGAPGPESRLSFASIWSLAALSLFVVYVAQEFLEGLLAGGHPHGLAGVLGAGGWLSLPLSIVIGAAIAYCITGARKVIAFAAAKARRTHRARSVVPTSTGWMDPPARRRRAPLSSLAAGRAPPARG